MSNQTLAEAIAGDLIDTLVDYGTLHYFNRERMTAIIDGHLCGYRAFFRLLVPMIQEGAMPDRLAGYELSPLLDGTGNEVGWRIVSQATHEEW